ncbi:hypothetical protein [Nonlabens ulvanivorans]|uniref:hypothetical protein n=1 Tax=Nonlabens ulvanivorans TaxID=906888 RepID=UPI0029434FB0|nr:hypothetical protein [Nonlabens ulvanivorans]WOI22269.1 hypothetical protein R1T42_11395 [Nonlabens ulvanivorans]
MKNYFLTFSIVAIAISCTSKKAVNDLKPEPNYFLFEYYDEESTEGDVEFFRSLATSIDSTGLKGLDSLVTIYENKIARDSVKTRKWIQNDIALKVEEDSIWRYEEYKGDMRGDYQLISKSNGILRYYNKARNINYKNDTLFNTNEGVTFKIDKKDVKTIKGYKCYKVIIEKENLVLRDYNTGKATYELYVTDEIKLPTHSVLNIPTNSIEVFPLEAVVCFENKAFSKSFYNIKVIE